MTDYATGLRISEVLGLRVGDPDKGSKDPRDHLRVPHPGRCVQARENCC
jgi:integrase